MFGLDGKVAAVVGAASGIGEAVALGCDWLFGRTVTGEALNETAGDRG